MEFHGKVDNWLDESITSSTDLKTKPERERLQNLPIHTESDETGSRLGIAFPGGYRDNRLDL